MKGISSSSDNVH